MKQFVRCQLIGILFITAAALTFGVSQDAETESSMRRFGIFIGSNNGGRDRAMLRYAVSDARSVSKVFSEMGGIASGDSVLLIEPTIKEINSQIDSLQKQVVSSKGKYKRTEVVVYYSGHSDEEGLLLNREKYYYHELRNRINNISADMKVVILDSCASGAFTRIKGGEKTQAFLIDSSLSAEGYAFLTSSSADESSQESDRIGASYFTHSLVAGLRGAADSVGDGRVTLNELYRFAYTETLAKTETSMYGTQHPSYDIQVSGTGDLVLTDVRGTSASLAFEEKLIGRLSIRDSSDYLIAEVTKTAYRQMELGLEPGVYRVTLQQGNTLLQADFILIEGKRTVITGDDFKEISAVPTRPRGEQEPPYSRGRFPNLYTFFINVVSEDFRFPLVGFVNIANGNHSLPQVGYVNWNTGNLTGFQASFVNTVCGDFAGFQAGFVNTNIGGTKGIQAGFVNTNIGDTKGVQLGFVNINIGDTSGLQMGFVNSAMKLNGVQFGFVNYVDRIEEGLPIGFLSIVRKGGYHAVEYGFSEFFPVNAAFKIGVDKFYTSFLFAYDTSGEPSWDKCASGVGLGSIIPVFKFLFINTELNFLSMVNWSGNGANTYGNVNMTSLVTSLGLKIGNHLSVTAGPSFTWMYSNNQFGIDSSYNVIIYDTETTMPKPKYSFYTNDINKNNSFIIGARAAVQLRF